MMRLKYLATLFFALVVFAGAPVIAEDHGGGTMAGHSMDAAASPASASSYAGMEKRTVKALSDEQIDNLKAGRGMGLALAGELNGYPGPAHVLELADALQLSDQQRTQAKALFDAMKDETIPIGERIIAEETALDRLFAERRINPSLLNEATSRIGTAEGELRSAHLRYHLAMAQVLSPAQTARYAELRGYAGGADHGHGMR